MSQMNKQRIRRILSVLLAVLLLSALFTACAEEAGWQKEENTGRDAVSYPYLIRTPSAVWHISKADIELLGEDAYYKGLHAAMDLAEADFADARAALEGYIFDEIPPIDIYTDFCNKGELSFIAWAYYDDTRNEIRLFDGWIKACYALQHEYVHYLTMHCADPATPPYYWAESIADYITHYACKNRLARSVNMGRDVSRYLPEMREAIWDEEENCVDPRLLYMVNGIFCTRGYIIGEKYFDVRNQWMTRTEDLQGRLTPDMISYEEAAGIMAYLVDTYGKETVFGNWTADPKHLETVFGKTFKELYSEWAAWNEEQCLQAGIVIPDLFALAEEQAQ